MFYPKLVHELNKGVSNKQDVRFFVFAVRHEAVVLQREKGKDKYTGFVLYSTIIIIAMQHHRLLFQVSHIN